MKAITKQAMAHGMAVAGYMVVVKGVTKGVDLIIKVVQKKKGA
jgi:hypothetical protein